MNLVRMAISSKKFNKKVRKSFKALLEEGVPDYFIVNAIINYSLKHQLNSKEELLQSDLDGLIDEMYNAHDQYRTWISDEIDKVNRDFKLGKYAKKIKTFNQ